MPGFLPISDPSSLLSLISADKALAEEADQIPVPPVDPDSPCRGTAGRISRHPHIRWPLR